MVTQVFLDSQAIQVFLDSAGTQVPVADLAIVVTQVFLVTAVTRVSLDSQGIQVFLGSVDTQAFQASRVTQVIAE